ncbi:MAG: hypothetical protein HOV81_30325 [Kofleriaceae bacterium]|nr:hypothetical protein [Kofleriaceae bacterium]
MTCKSHALLLVLAVLALLPDDVHAWSAMPDLTAATSAVDHGVALASSAHHQYRCGLYLIVYIAGAFFGGIGLLLVWAITAKLRDARFRRATPESVSPLVAGHVVMSLRRIHYTAALLGYAAMMAAWGVDQFTYALLLAIVASVVAWRGFTASAAKQWLYEGASAARRGEVLVVYAPTERALIRAPKSLFRAAQAKVMPAATARLATR